jgi:hypothetical protein
MRRLARFTWVAAVVVTVALGVTVLVGTGDVWAGKPGGGNPGGSKCPRTGIACADIWDPVICSDGVVYSNGCYAYVACATGCVPYGDI